MPVTIISLSKNGDLLTTEDLGFYSMAASISFKLFYEL